MTQTNLANEMFTKRAADFMRATDSLVPTNDTPDMNEVLRILELADMTFRAGELDHEAELKRECMILHFQDDWCRAFPECFKYKDGTKTRNVNFYVAKAEEIIKKSGIEEWEIEEINEPFIDRINNLRDLVDWFRNAEDPQSVIKFVY